MKEQRDRNFWIFERVLDGATLAMVAGDEGLSIERVRQIVGKVGRQIRPQNTGAALLTPNPSEIRADKGRWLGWLMDHRRDVGDARQKLRSPD